MAKDSGLFFRLLLATILSGCVTIPHTPSGKYECTTVGENIRVQIEPGTALDCSQAEAATSAALNLLRQHDIHTPSDWTVLYTYFYVGLDEGGGELVGVTHADTKEIKVRVVYDNGRWHSPNTVLHELRHASEAEQGHGYASSTHTGWCADGWASLERNFSGVTAFLCGE